MQLPGGPHVIVAIFCGFWLAVAIFVVLRSGAASRSRRSVQRRSAQAEDLLERSPSVPLIVYPRGGIEGPSGALAMLGVETLPRNFEALIASGIFDDAGQALKQAVEDCRASGRRFAMSSTIARSGRKIDISGGPAPASFSAGSIVLWLHDATEVEAQVRSLNLEVARLSGTLNAITGLLEAAPFPIWHRGPDLRLALVNSAYVRAVEADAALAVVKSGIELIDEEEGRTALSEAATVLQKGEAVSRTVPATIAGERRMMQVVEVPLGEGVAGYAIDVHDREQAHADLARFVRAQRDMLDRLSAGVAQFSRDRSLIFVNQPFARLFDIGGDFLVDNPEFDRVLDRMREKGRLPEVRDYPDWKNERRSWFISGLAPNEEDWLLPGGKHLRVVAQPLPDGGLLLIFEDRTEQIQLASARDTLLRVRTATFDNLFEAIGVFASDGRLHLWNSRFREVWGFDEEQLAMHPRIDVLVAEIGKKLKRPNRAQTVRELVRSATVERKQRHGRVSFRDGREFAFAAVPLPDGNALFTMLDVTDSRMIEAALRDKAGALEEADRVKTAFVSNMSYELRTPLTSIAGFAEMLAAGYAGELPDTAKEYVDAITESVARLSGLIDNVLDLTQSDVGGLLLAEDRIDLRALCAEVAERHADRATRKNIELSLSLEPSGGEMVGDRKRLAQALDKVIGNAIAYTDEGGRVLVHATGSPRAAEITVSDNGRGIDPADSARVFDRFQRAGRDAVDGRALGLGLPLAKQFVEAHGGVVKLQSRPGRGTRVTFFLPRGA